MKSKNIAIVANWDWVIHNFRLPFAHYLKEQGLNVSLICPPGKYSENFIEQGFHFIPWEINRRTLNPLIEFRSFVQIFSIYRKNKFNSVHQFTAKPILYGTIAARIAGIQVILNNFTGLGFLYSANLLAKFLHLITLPFYRFAFRSKKVIAIFQNPFVQNKMIKQRVAKIDRSFIVPGTGIDISRFSSKNSFSEKGEVRILLVARLLFDKGIKEYVEAANLLSKLHPNARFLLAGDPDKGNPDFISDEQINKWKSLGILEFLGHRDDIPKLLNSADIAVLPSYHEGIPLFLIEAAASSLPIVATDIEGIRLIVEDGKNGILVPIKDEKKLAEAISKLIDNPVLREKMGRQSRKIATDKFDLSIIHAKYSAIYRKLGILA